MLVLEIKTVNLYIVLIKNVGNTVINSSQDLSGVEKLCDRNAFINKGKILKIGTQEEVNKLIGSGISFQVFLDRKKQELISKLENYRFKAKFIKEQNDSLVYIQDRKDNKDFFNLLKDYEILNIIELEPPLEDLYIKLIKREIDFYNILIMNKENNNTKFLQLNQA